MLPCPIQRYPYRFGAHGVLAVPLPLQQCPGASAAMAPPESLPWQGRGCRRDPRPPHTLGGSPPPGAPTHIPGHALAGVSGGASAVPLPPCPPQFSGNPTASAVPLPLQRCRYRLCGGLSTAPPTSHSVPRSPQRFNGAPVASALPHLHANGRPTADGSAASPRGRPTDGWLAVGPPLRGQWSTRLPDIGRPAAYWPTVGPPPGGQR